MFDDVIEFLEIATDPQTYTNPSAGFQRVREIGSNTVRQKAVEAANEGAKRFALVPLGAKLLDRGIDEVGLDTGRAVRDRIGFTRSDVAAGGQSDLLDDETTLHNQDSAPHPPGADTMVHGWFDP